MGAATAPQDQQLLQALAAPPLSLILLKLLALVFILSKLSQVGCG
jgi:hypothetical protein